MRPPVVMHRPGGGPPGSKFLSEEEKKNRPKVTKALLGRIFGYLKPYLPQFVLVFAALLVSSVLGLFPAVITGKIIDLIGQSDATVSRLLIFLVLAFSTMLASNVISVVENYINSWISQHIIFDMKNQMYDHLQHQSHSFFTGERQGDIITRMNSDIGGVSSVISGTLTSVVSNTLTIITSVVTMLSYSPMLSLVGICIIPLLVIPTKKVGHRRFVLLGEGQVKHDELNEQINETLSVSGSMLVKLFTKENDEYKKFRSINSEVTRINIKELRANSWFRVVMGMFIEIGPLLIYFAGGLFIIAKFDTALTVGTITIIVSLINRIYRPVRTLLDIDVDFVRSLALFERIFTYFDLPVTIKEPDNPETPDLTDCPIEFSDVHFSYEKGKEILKGLSFCLPTGKVYAIVGPSGSGKSTTIGMIPRLYDVDSGRVSIAGVDVRRYSLSYLRKSIGVVTQDTYLFNGTIRENLLYAKPDATKEELENACRIANVDAFVNSLPDGLETVVGNRGLKLSGGEKQRISIARVVLKNPKILILDEATSSLDSISENAIQGALEQLMVGRTSLVIAHRLSTVLAADRILVIDGGQIVDYGTHEQLMEHSGKYRELYETQFRKILDKESAKNNNSSQ